MSSVEDNMKRLQSLSNEEITRLLTLVPSLPTTATSPQPPSTIISGNSPDQSSPPSSTASLSLGVDDLLEAVDVEMKDVEDNDPAITAVVVPETESLLEKEVIPVAQKEAKAAKIVSLVTVSEVVKMANPAKVTKPAEARKQVLQVCDDDRKPVVRKGKGSGHPRIVPHIIVESESDDAPIIKRKRSDIDKTAKDEGQPTATKAPATKKAKTMELDGVIMKKKTTPVMAPPAVAKFAPSQVPSYRHPLQVTGKDKKIWSSTYPCCTRCQGLGTACYLSEGAVSRMSTFFKERLDTFTSTNEWPTNRRPFKTTCLACQIAKPPLKCDYALGLQKMDNRDPWIWQEDEPPIKSGTFTEEGQMVALVKSLDKTLTQQNDRVAEIIKEQAESKKLMLTLLEEFREYAAL